MKLKQCAENLNEITQRKRSSTQKRAASIYCAGQTMGRARVRRLAFKIDSTEIRFTGVV
jgi:hypothetical protein